MKKSLAILLVLALALGSVFANGTPEATTAQPEKKLEEINVAYMPNYASLCSVVAGMETGAFAEQGLKVNLVQFADGPTIIAAMESGSIDVGYIGQGAHKLCINGRAKIFAMSHVGNGDAVLGLKSHGVTSAKDLKGKKVGYASGTSSESILRLTLESAGLTMKDVKAMEMDASGIVSAMTSGSLDACATWSPNTFTIKDVMKDDAVTLANNLTFADKSAAISSWIVMSKYAETNSDKLLRFTKGLYKGMDYRAANIEQTAKWVAKVLAADYNTIWNQRGDAEWITSEQLVKEVKDGTIEHLYEVQKKGFGTAVKQETPVSSYVLFDNMLKAGQLIPSLKEK